MDTDLVNQATRITDIIRSIEWLKVSIKNSHYVKIDVGGEKLCPQLLTESMLKAILKEAQHILSIEKAALVEELSKELDITINANVL